MANKKFGLGIPVIMLVFGMMVVGCITGGKGSGSNTDPKTLVITMPAAIFNYGEDGFMVGLFPVGTTSDKAQSLSEIVAGVTNVSPDWTYSGTDPVTLTLPLFVLSDDSRWNGNGVYDIYAILEGDGRHFYKGSSVNISSAETKVTMSSANEISP